MTNEPDRFDRRHGKPTGLNWELPEHGGLPNPKKPIVFGDTKSVSPQVRS